MATEQFMGQLDAEFVETLQKGLGDFKTTLKEHIKNVRPRDQYIVLVAGTFLITLTPKMVISTG